MRLFVGSSVRLPSAFVAKREKQAYLWIQELVCYNQYNALPAKDRTEHTNQIAMRTMQLDPRKPRVGHQPRRINKLPRHGIDIPLCHLPRRRERQPADDAV